MLCLIKKLYTLLLMQKKEQKIKERILHIENGLFDEDDIKLLLIEIREKLKDETFLKEICHFVAHSERNSGICHKKVDVRYAKLKFIKDNPLAAARILSCGSLYTQLTYWRERLVRVYEVSVEEKLTTLQNIIMSFF